MELKFDKEMDALLRGAARSGEVLSNAAFETHLDADEISMFAEYAMPEKARIRAVKHFADCERCRIILTNTITLGSEAEDKAASNVSAKSESEIKAAIPWYKRLFETRNLAFGMGALALIFVGMIGFLVLQSSMLTSRSDLAQMEESSANSDVAADSSGPTAANVNDGDLPAASDANQASSDTDADSAAEHPEKEAGEKPVREKELGYGVEKEKQDTDQDEIKSTPEPLGQNANNDLTAKKIEKTDDKPSPEGYVYRDRRDLRRGNTPRPKVAAAPLPATSPPPEQDNELMAAEAAKVVRNKEEKAAAGRAAATRRIGGKTFTQKNRIWYDSAYRGGDATTVRRGTNEYKKLDPGLRAITDKFNETVVVVWKSKAYRIQ